jgi:hypothetical protein
MWLKSHPAGKKDSSAEPVRVLMRSIEAFSIRNVKERSVGFFIVSISESHAISSG